MFGKSFSELEPHERVRAGGKVRPSRPPAPLASCRPLAPSPRADRSPGPATPPVTPRAAGNRSHRALTNPAAPPAKVGGGIRGGDLADPDRAPDPPAVKVRRALASARVGEGVAVLWGNAGRARRASAALATRGSFPPHPSAPPCPPPLKTAPQTTRPQFGEDNVDEPRKEEGASK
jgi:hypothetical protein